MVHRFAHADGSGCTWTNNRDRDRVVWLLKDAPLPDGRRGDVGQVYDIKLFARQTYGYPNDAVVTVIK